MKPTSTRTVGDRPDTEQTHIDVADAGVLLAALEDEDCRSILAVTDADALSASELSDACDLPLSTTYRKIDKLTDAGLLEEQIRISTGGKHTSEYSLRIKNIHLSLGADDGVELEVTQHAGSDSLDSVLAGAD
jgi:DNA-binding transcriptional ArsR family regulator